MVNMLWFKKWKILPLLSYKFLISKGTQGSEIINSRESLEVSER